MACNCITDSEATEVLSWAQMTLLIQNADNVILTKYKVQDETFEKVNEFYLKSIRWAITPQKLIVGDLISTSNPADKETFDLNSEYLSFVYDRVKNIIYADVVLTGTHYRYLFDFKGSQIIDNKNLLKLNKSDSNVKMGVAL